MSLERLKLPGISWHRYPLATSQMIREARMVFQMEQIAGDDSANRFSMIFWTFMFVLPVNVHHVCLPGPK